MADAELSPELAALVPQLVQPAAVVDQLRPLADGGDDYAVVLTAWALAQVGRWQEGIPYALEATKKGAGFVAANYVGNLMGAPEYREQALDLLSDAMDAGWAVDPFGWLPTFAQRSDS